MKRLLFLLIPAMLMLSAALADSVQFEPAKSILTVACDHAVPGSAVSFMAVHGKPDSYSISPETVHYLRQLTADSHGHISISIIGNLTEDYVFLLGGAAESSELHMIGSFSLEDSNHLYMPSALTAIEEESFYGDAGLEAVILSDSITSIGARAFMNCVNLLYLEIPDSVLEIGEDAFAGCPGITIGCEENSAAHAYALEHQLPVLLGQ